jgi:hypothetical protein
MNVLVRGTAAFLARQSASRPAIDGWRIPVSPWLKMISQRNEFLKQLRPYAYLEATCCCEDQHRARGRRGLAPGTSRSRALRR